MFRNSVQIPFDDIQLDGDLTIPDESKGIIVFAHGTASSRHHPRNLFLVEVMVKAGFATLLPDLLTVEEEADTPSSLNVDLLARRLSMILDWLDAKPKTSSLPIGLFGAGVGAGAAMVAVLRSRRVGAIVLRGGRPDLAGPALSRVRAPTLLIVGGNDETLISLNRKALGSLQTLNVLKIIPGATHMFEEPGALEQVAFLARGWFIQHLSSVGEKTS